MADIDIDLNAALDPDTQGDVTVGDAVVDMTNVQPDSSKRGAELAGQKLLLDERDQDFTEHVVALADPDKKSSLERSVSARQDAVFRNANQVLTATLSTDPDQFPAQALEQQERVAAADSPIAPEKAVVESVTSLAPVSVDKLVKQQEEFRLAALNDVAELISNQGTWDKVTDFAGFFVPFNLTADLSDVLDEKFDFTNATDIEQFVTDFQALPADRKAEYWPELMQSILSATGTNVVGVDVSDDNVLKAAGILINLLNPEGAETQDTERTFDILFGASDVLLSGVLGTAASNLSKANNLVRKTSRLGDVERATNLNIGAMGDESVARTTGVSAQEAATNALPIGQEGWRPEFAKGLAPTTSAKLNEFSQTAEGLTRSFRDESALIKEGLLRKQEKEVVIKDAVTRLLESGQGRDVANEGLHIDNVRPGKIDETGFVLKYDQIKNGKTELNVDLRVKWEVDGVTGDFRETIENAPEGFEYGLSPAAWAHTGAAGDFLASFKSASNIADLSAAASSKMLDLVTASNKPVSGVLGVAARKRINAVEIAGDEWLDKATGLRGKTFSPDELMAGIPTRDGTVKLTSPAELETYYKHRIVADQFWQLENAAAGRRLDVLGFTKEVDLNGTKQAARNFEDVNAAKLSTRDLPARTAAYDRRTDTATELTEEALDEVYENGSTLVRLSNDEAVTYGDGSIEHFDYAIVSRADLNRRSAQTIHYKQGYVPKVNQGVEYLVKENIPATKRGVPNFSRPVTHRFFASKKDADVYRQEQIETFLRENPDATLEAAEARFTRVADREQTPLQRIHESAGSSGGLYTGARSSHDIASGLSGVRTDRLSVFDSFQRNAQHIGSLVSRNEWRIGEEQRWLNTVDALGLENKGFLGTTVNPATKEGRALEKMREHIKRWNGVPTQDETAFSGAMQRFHDWALTQARRTPGLKDKENIKSLLWLKHTEPAAAMKAAAFNLALGVLNPAQLFVQASAMTVALSRFPATAAKTVGYAAKLALTDRMKDVGTLKRIDKVMNDVDTPLFDQVRLAWERSGLRESVRQNADLNSADSYGVMSMDAIKRISDANLLLYRNGELANRRVSFTASYLDWNRKNPGKTPSSDDLKAIKADANLSMLELNHANRAMWQGGADVGTFRNILGVMTQFQQVSAKALELVFKGTARGGFTNVEKTRILLAQTALYGAAGIPIGGAIVTEALDWYDINMSKQDQELLNQGIMGALVVNALDADVSVAPRLAPFGGIGQTIRDVIFDDVPLAEKAFGVFGDMGGRIGTAMDRLKPMITSGIKGRDMTRADYLDALSIIGEVPSSSRGLVKAWIMHNQHKIKDRHGNAVVVDDFNLQTEVAVALGFRPIEEAETRIVQMSNKDYQDRVTELSDVVVDLYGRYLNRVEEPQAGDKLSRALQVLFESVDNAQMEQDIRSAVERKIDKGGTVQERELKKFLDRTMPEDITEGVKATRDNFFAQSVSERAVVQPLDIEE